mmetsp:Transcript_48216/g.136210  ORF Transcript_48216/g.136210 Transcript_48216/m.136210 type:complete len:87 (-) Transcript_48216:525-785(-)
MQRPAFFREKRDPPPGSPMRKPHYQLLQVTNSRVAPDGHLSLQLRDGVPECDLQRLHPVFFCFGVLLCLCIKDATYRRMLCGKLKC